MTALVSDVNRDADSFVAVVLDRLHFTATHGDVLSEPFAQLGLSGAGAHRAGMVEYVTGKLLQEIEVVVKSGIGHRRLHREVGLKLSG